VVEKKVSHLIALFDALLGVEVPMDSQVNSAFRVGPFRIAKCPDETPFTFVSDEFNGKNKDVNGKLMPFRQSRSNCLESVRKVDYTKAPRKIFA
jgi:hypothetical protein